MERQPAAEGQIPWKGLKHSSPQSGFAQIFKIKYKIDGLIPLKIEKISPKRTFWAKPPPGEGLTGVGFFRRDTDPEAFLPLPLGEGGGEGGSNICRTPCKLNSG
jgi:hypothetical protein